MSLRKGVFLTAFNRPDYFREALNSWRTVRGIEDWTVLIRLEPSDSIAEHLEAIQETERPDVFIPVVNPENYGVLHHPWVGFEDMFSRFFDFVVRTEDDLVVSNDILEYFSWAAEEYKHDQEIASVLGFTNDYGPENEVRRVEDFNPWTWGTWHDRWDAHMALTWDHDYSTYNGYPGNESGWDWNLKTRVFPAKGLKSIQPLASRVQNIGAWGVHGTPENLVQSESFVPFREPQSFCER